MKSLVQFIKEQNAIKEASLESTKFLLVTAKNDSKASKDLQEDWADAILTTTDPTVFLYAIPVDTAEALKDTYKDDVTLYIIDPAKYPNLSDFEDAFGEGEVLVDDLEEYTV